MRTPLLITGGAGFIGAVLVRRLIPAGEAVVNVNALTYADNPDSLGDASHATSYNFEHIDIRDAAAADRVFEQHRPRAVVHLAAEPHVDRSIDAPDAFIIGAGENGRKGSMWMTTPPGSLRCARTARPATRICSTATRGVATSTWSAASARSPTRSARPRPAGTSG